MHNMYKNPFSVKDIERHKIWEMLVDRDIKAFIKKDWSIIAADFVEENFIGIDANYHKSPDAWELNFPNLEAYKIEWLKQASEIKEIEWGEDIKGALFRVSHLQNIEIRKDRAVAHKIILGHLLKSDGSWMPVNWQTLYHCRKIKKNWKITGFIGYLPCVFSDNRKTSLPAKKIPDNASQHKTAGPYSPVLIVNPKQLAVISGQAAIDNKGSVVGKTIEKQTAYTLNNCRKQLRSAGYDLNDVFKVNVFLKDLDDWPRCNNVYKKYFKEPLPVRTAVQTGLLENLLVEIEMWATKS